MEGTQKVNGQTDKRTDRGHDIIRPVLYVHIKSESNSCFFYTHVQCMFELCASFKSPAYVLAKELQRQEWHHITSYAIHVYWAKMLSQ